MAKREAPVRAHKPKQSADAGRARGPQTPAQSGRCFGAAAQLASLHRTLRNGPAFQLRAGGAAATNRTGLPDRLKAGVEALSGVSLDGVKVHRNSSKPAQLNALAYAQGSDIHLAPGQERHLPHETWHIVQQAQGRVRPTLQMKERVLVNDDQGLELEADAMGRKASQTSDEGNASLAPFLPGVANSPPLSAGPQRSAPGAPIQRLSYTGALATTGVTPPKDVNEARGSGQLVLAGGVPPAAVPRADLVEAVNVPTKKDRLSALAEAARKFAEVGATVRQIEGAIPLVWVWANGATPMVLEPFIYKIVVPYQPTGKKQAASKKIELQYQITPGLFGYVVRQKDSDDSAASTIANAGPAGPQTPGHSPTFNMMHHGTRDTALSTVLDQSGKATKAENEERLDARTKLAGEGSRWLLVLNNMGSIRDFSKIWTTVPKTKFIRYVDFRTLWLNWVSVFDRKFNIPDSVVAKELHQSSEWVGKVHDVKREQFKEVTGDIEVKS